MFKTEYMAYLIAVNLYDTVLNIIEDCGKDKKIQQIKLLRQKTGGSLRFCKNIIEAFHKYDCKIIYDQIMNIYLDELVHIEELERKSAIQFSSSLMEIKEAIQKEEDFTILFEYNDFPPYHAKSEDEAYRVHDLIKNLNGDQPKIMGIYKKI